MPQVDPLTIVDAWLAAANAQDADRLVQLSDPAIEVVGPRGSGSGHQLLRDWVARAGLGMETLRAFADGATVVLDQRGVWRAPEGGAVTGERRLASVFTVAGGRVARFARFDTLDEALRAVGLPPAGS